MAEELGDDGSPFHPHRPGLVHDIGGPVVPGDPNACKFMERYYPEGSIEMIDGRPATCRGGRWIGEGDDPPPHLPDGAEDLPPVAS